MVYNLPENISTIKILIELYFDSILSLKSIYLLLVIISLSITEYTLRMKLDTTSYYLCCTIIYEINMTIF